MAKFNSSSLNFAVLFIFVLILLNSSQVKSKANNICGNYPKIECNENFPSFYGELNVTASNDVIPSRVYCIKYFYDKSNQELDRYSQRSYYEMKDQGGLNYCKNYIDPGNDPNKIVVVRKPDDCSIGTFLQNIETNYIGSKGAFLIVLNENEIPIIKLRDNPNQDQNFIVGIITESTYRDIRTKFGSFDYVKSKIIPITEDVASLYTNPDQCYHPRMPFPNPEASSNKPIFLLIVIFSFIAICVISIAIIYLVIFIKKRQREARDNVKQANDMGLVHR